MTKVAIRRSGGGVVLRTGDLVAIDGVDIGIVIGGESDSVDVWRATSERKEGGQLYALARHRLEPVKEVKATV